jgi:hypothetical protein
VPFKPLVPEVPEEPSPPEAPSKFTAQFVKVPLPNFVITVNPKYPVLTLYVSTTASTWFDDVAAEVIIIDCSGV